MRRKELFAFTGEYDSIAFKAVRILKAFMQVEIHQAVVTDISDQFAIAIDTDRGAIDMQGVFYLSGTASQKINSTLFNIPAVIGIGYQVILLCFMFEYQS